jgi:FG-GAP-like repeat
VAIWFLNGTQVTQSTGVATVPTTCAIAGTRDFNGDGKSDILWHNTNTNTRDVLRRSPSRRVSARPPPTWLIVETGDFDGDGKSDILWHDTSGNVAIWFMNGAQVSQSAGIGNAPTVWSIQGANADWGSVCHWPSNSAGVGHRTDCRR